MQQNKVEKIYPKIDETGRFVKFGRVKLAEEIKTFLDGYQTQIDEFVETQESKFRNLEKTLEKTDDTLTFVQNKYDLVRDFLGAEPLDNPALQKFKTLIANDFIEFANNESALAEEAQAVLLLQDVERRLEEIVTFPAIYNKNIVAVGGGFSAGKSEFLNSLFTDKEIKLPVGINPVTAIPTYITAGEINTINGYSYKGGVVELSSEFYKKLSHDFIKSLGFNLKEIAPVIAIETPMKSYDNICFVDTPGYNPPNAGYTGRDIETSKEYLEHANTLLWMIDIEAGTLPNSDLNFLESVSLEDKKKYIIVSRADVGSQSEIEETLDEIEDILDENDIEYEGICAYDSMSREEKVYRKISLFDFLEEVNSPLKVQENIMSELNTVFDMYEYAITEQIKWTKNIQSHLHSLELDLLESGMDVDDSEMMDKRLEKMKDMFKASHLEKQYKQLGQLREKIILSVKDIFDDMENSS